MGLSNLLARNRRNKPKDKPVNKREWEAPDDEKTSMQAVDETIMDYSVQTAPGCPVRISKVHAGGRRSNQQDSFGLSEVADIDVIMDKGVLAVVADGMGGMEKSDEVSMIVTVAMLSYFDERTLEETPDQELLHMAEYANNAVNDHAKANGIGSGRGGSTLVAAIVREQLAYWISIGDSAVYLYRKQALEQLNEKHTYAVELAEKVKRGELTEADAEQDPQRDSLTSYIGAGSIAYIDYNQQALELEAGDRLLLMSDGVFGTISKEEIENLMQFEVDEAARKMEYLIESKNKSNQDNYTALIMECI